MKHIKTILSVLLTVCMTLAAYGTTAEAAAAAKSPIHIATKPMTEQYILGEMLKLIIEDQTEYTCEITKGIGGGTSNIMPAMKSGDFDLYPEYTSSGYVLVLGHDAKGVDDTAMWEQLVKEYHDLYHMAWLGHYGFNNTYCLTVRGEVARQYNLKTCSDMTAVADQLIFGGNPDYIEREDGFQAVVKTYGYNFKDIKSIDIGLKYVALAATPRVLLMDEPFGAVDEITRRSLQEEIRKLQQELGITVVFVTHDINEALRLGSRMLVMDAGTIVQLDTTEAIRSAPANDFVRELIFGAAGRG